MLSGLVAWLGWAGRRRAAHCVLGGEEKHRPVLQAAVVAAFVMCTVTTVLGVVLVVPILLATAFVFEGIG